jgi:hypothetical protein
VQMSSHAEEGETLEQRPSATELGLGHGLGSLRAALGPLRAGLGPLVRKEEDLRILAKN